MDLKLFKIRAYNGALAANLTMNFTFAGMSFLLVLWLENARGYSAVESGVLMLPATVGVFLCIPLGGRLANRRGGRLPSVVGLVVACAGLFLLGSLGTRSSTEYLAVALIVIGLGLGLVSTPVANTTVGEVPIDLAGTAAGVFKMSSMLGGALGVAVLTAVARELTTKDAASVVEASGLTPADISQFRQALVNSSSFRKRSPHCRPSSGAPWSRQPPRRSHPVSPTRWRSRPSSPSSRRWSSSSCGPAEAKPTAPPLGPNQKTGQTRRAPFWIPPWGPMSSRNSRRRLADGPLKFLGDLPLQLLDGACRC
ncbi:MFS transporter [Streptomyces sioyaensis]|uniref:MFS transporter n=1 Tax=Streptomyces sioyaensis TaxID=67364 RepID=UPI0037AB5417